MLAAQPAGQATAFAGIDVAAGTGGTFFVHDPGKERPKDHRFPFATLVTSDAYDQFSDLNRPCAERSGAQRSTQGMIGLGIAIFAAAVACICYGRACAGLAALPVIRPRRR
ncbi:MAG TPA: DUF6194 family protein [Gemmataceae bacterium]|nr:DUF6194 family protein [Gemmataceae bacterium]